MQSFKNYFFAENIYRDNKTGNLAYRVEPNQNKELGSLLSNTEQLVAKEIMMSTIIRGQMSTYIPSKNNRIFIGYDVFTTKESDGKKIRNSVYAAVKGTSNSLKGNQYVKAFQTIPENDYNMLIRRAVNAFIDKERAPFDFILYPASRSSHAYDIAKFIDVGLKQKFVSGLLGQRAQSVTIQEIPKKPINIETIKEVVHIEDLVNNVVKNIERHADVTLSRESKIEVIDILTKTLIEFLTKKVLNIKDGEGYSTATHFRSTHNKEIFDNVVELLNGPGIIPELDNKLTGFTMSGHLNDYTESHHDLKDLKMQLDQYDKDGKKRTWVGKMRLLVVDDNINSGDMYKQIAPLGDMLRNCDFFFLMKDMKYKI